MTPEDINILIKIIIGVVAVFLLGSLTTIIAYFREKWNLNPLNMPELNFRGRTSLGLVLISIVIWISVLLLVIGCSPRITAMNTQGKLLKSEPDRVYGIFEDMMGKPGYYAGEWFYFPGLGIINVEEYRLRVTLEKIR